jgi:methylene-tetrahydromethanopterin dehydrogenase
VENALILHFLTPAAQASPFDVNMAYDAGYDAVVPYTGVTLADVATLTQDAIFSRGPKRVRRTGIFIGGRDLDLALDMLAAAKKAMVPPFEVSVFADPSGAFTTAAAVVAAVEKHLRAKHDAELARRRVLVLGPWVPQRRPSRRRRARVSSWRARRASAGRRPRAIASGRATGSRSSPSCSMRTPRRSWSVLPR